MAVQEPQAPSQEVAAPSEDAGKTVWCENGCGNRILDTTERIPFPCPTGCGGMMTENEPTGLTGPTKTVKLPSVGRIVHVLVAPGTVRPAIVCGRERDGRLFVQVFRDDHDPNPPGLYSGMGVVRYGSHVGGWTWPPRDESLTFETSDE